MGIPVLEQVEQMEQTGGSLVDLRRVRGQLTKSADNEKTKDKSNMGRQMRKGKYHSEARISGVLETLSQKSPPNRHVPLNMSKWASLPALLQSVCPPTCSS